MSTKDLQFPLAELATTMMREVFQSIQDSATEQLDGYATLVAKASLSDEDYLAEVLGSTPEARTKLAESYVREVVLPALQMPVNAIPDPVLLSNDQRALVVSMFDGLVIVITSGGSAEESTISDLITPSGGGSFPWSITRGRLVSAARTRLERDARTGLTKIRTMLKNGLPQVNVTSGQLCAKVTLATTESTSQLAASKGPAAPSIGLAVRVANERLAAFTRSQELVGSVRLDFRVGTFPQVDTRKS